MAKKSHKHFPQSRKENSSCMEGLVGIFYIIRQRRSTRRLLSNKKRRSGGDLGPSYSRNRDDFIFNREEDDENLANLYDADTEEAGKVNFGISSVKKLMEEEMSRTHYSRKKSMSKIECLKSELGIESITGNSHDQQYKNGVMHANGLRNYLNASARLTSRKSEYPNISDRLSSGMDMASFMADYCNTGFQFKDCLRNNSELYPSRVSFENVENSELYNDSLTIFRKAVVDIAKSLLKQTSTFSSKLAGNGEVPLEEEFIDALKMLNLNRDLFLKLLQDPDSPIRKHIQDLQNVCIDISSKLNENLLLGEPTESKQLQKKSGHHFFRKREKFAEINQLNECGEDDAVNRIVVLRPNEVRNRNPSRTVSSLSSIHSHCGLENKDGRKQSFHFSLKEIKRRFRNAVGANRKESFPITMDGILHKIPYGQPISRAAEISCRKAPIENGDKRKLNAKKNQKKIEPSFSTRIFNENKKLNKNAALQMLFREAAFYDEARKHLSDLLLMDSKSESSPAIQASKPLGRMLSFPGFSHLSPRPSSAREMKPDHFNQNFDTKYSIPSCHKESFINLGHCLEAKNGSMEITELEDSIQIEEDNQVEVQFESISNEDDLPCGIFKEEESSILSEPGKFEDRFQPLSSPTAPITLSSVAPQEQFDIECTADNTGRPCPISVLECPFIEDMNSPLSLITEHETNAETKTQPTKPQIDTSAADSGLSDSETNTTTLMELDEASLFDELEISHGFLIHDPKLLFDSIDEVVSEIKERHFSCTNWTPLIRPSIRVLKNQQYFINEAQKRIDWHLDVQFPRTLEQTVKKDFDGEAWFNLQPEAENAAIEVGSVILDHLIEETAQELLA